MMTFILLVLLYPLCGLLTLLVMERRGLWWTEADAKATFVIWFIPVACELCLLLSPRRAVKWAWSVIYGLADFNKTHGW